MLIKVQQNKQEDGAPQSREILLMFVVVVGGGGNQVCLPSPNLQISA